MRVGDIDTSHKRDPELLYYLPGSYKTSEYVGDIEFPLGKVSQRLLAPYLEGKKPSEAVFSPGQAMQERSIEKWTNRKTKVPPSQSYDCGSVSITGFHFL
jgi:hypothetical protein